MDIEFNAGDEILQPFRIMVAGEVADLAGCVVTAKVFSTNMDVLGTMAVGSGVQLLSALPANDGNHLVVTVPTSVTSKLALGRAGRLRVIVKNSDGVTMSTIDSYLNRLG